jgi:K+-sensing histidine kinase KdpD
MTQAGSNIDLPGSAVDRFVRANVTPWLSRTNTEVTLLGVAICSAVAVALLPVRDSMGQANVGLVLALVIALVGSYAGTAPGLVTAGWASLLFVVLHSAPHGIPTAEEKQDAVTAGLLLLTGAISGLVNRRLAATRRRGEILDDDLKRLHRVADVARRSTGASEVIDAAIEEISGELRLANAFVEHGPPSRAWLELGHNGRIRGISANDHDDRLATKLAVGVAIEIGPDARLVFIGNPQVKVEPRQLRVVVALADYAMIVACRES